MNNFSEDDMLTLNMLQHSKTNVSYEDLKVIYKIIKLAPQLEKTTTFYRGLSDENLNNMQNDIITFPMFFSCTSDINIASYFSTKQFILKFTLKEGTLNVFNYSKYLLETFKFYYENGSMDKEDYDFYVKNDEHEYLLLANTFKINNTYTQIINNEEYTILNSVKIN
jgi:hypothetical protein